MPQIYGDTNMAYKYKVADFYRKKWCGVYCIMDMTSNKRYVGQSKDIFGRWSQHSGGNKSGIGAAFEKDPIRFSWKILQLCKEEELNAVERKYIEMYGCIEPHGFNRTKGNKK